LLPHQYWRATLDVSRRNVKKSSRMAPNGFTWVSIL
jgi:hypothetical protein